MTDGSVTIDGLTKEFGSLTAVDDLSFQIDDGEFFTFLGPSGCGKTTTLRMLAGFEEPTEGRISIGGRDVTDAPPYDRDVGMVFQSYALFPHKTVGENVAFGLKMDGVGADERRERANDALAMVDLGGYAERSPTDLSGGQQQRVALARALVIEPSVLLLDEPLANLDLKLRQQMRFELKRLQDELGITTVYVTHDQQEALSMSDRILVMDDGHAEQVDGPTALYGSPTNEFVADFIGEANLIDATVESVSSDAVRVTLDATGTTVDIDASAASVDVAPGDDVVLNVRPEDIEFATGGDGAVTGTVEATTFYGQITTLHLDVGGDELRVDSFGRSVRDEYEAGDEVAVSWQGDDCLLLRGSA